MSALHWEARRKQAVVDQKAERHKNELEVSESAGNEDPYKASRIENIAETLCRDTATPTPALLYRSQARLVQNNSKAHNEKQACCGGSHHGTDNENQTYSAKIRNRYTSIDYIQQY